MEHEVNIAIARLFAKYEMPDAMECADLLRKTERNYLQALLKIKRLPTACRRATAFRIWIR